MQNLTTLASAIPEISLEAAKFEMGLVSLTMPPLRVICHPLLGLDIAYLCTKFDDCSCSRSSDMVNAH